VARPEPVVAADPGARPESAISISTLTRIAKDVVEGAFTPLWVRGEVSDFKAHRNGHWYFCLRDQSSQLPCVVWSRDRQRIPAAPDDGMQLSAYGQLTVYPARGDIQFRVSAMEAAGDGLWRKALELSIAKLKEEGLLAAERKRRLAAFPRRVAVVTSPDGAALHDILAVVRRRCPVVEIVVVPARVQGEGALPHVLRDARQGRDGDRRLGPGTGLRRDDGLGVRHGIGARLPPRLRRGCEVCLAVARRRREEVELLRRLVRRQTRGAALPPRAHATERSICSAAFTVLRRSIAIVMGPTPPGSGVISEASSLALSKSTSPTSR
jgi:hypothetical protein